LGGCWVLFGCFSGPLFFRICGVEGGFFSRFDRGKTGVEGGRNLRLGVVRGILSLGERRVWVCVGILLIRRDEGMEAMRLKRA